MSRDSLYDECVAITLSGIDDPLSAIRAKLTAAAVVLAQMRNENARAWSVYVERHLTGVRFMLRDCDGREVDLQRLPAEPKGAGAL